MVAFLLLTTTVVHLESVPGRNMQCTELHAELSNPRGRPSSDSALAHGSMGTIENEDAEVILNRYPLPISLLGPLARHLLAGVASTITIVCLAVEKPAVLTRFDSALDLAIMTRFLAGPRYGVVMVTTESKGNWVVDPAGCLLGFTDVLMPLAIYLDEKEGRDIESNILHAVYLDHITTASQISQMSSCLALA